MAERENILTQLGLVPVSDSPNALKQKQKLPELDKHNLHIALARLQSAGYKRLDEVASLLSPDLRNQAEDFRSRVSGAIGQGLSVTPTDPNEYMDCESIMLGLTHLFAAEYSDMLGVANAWIPDFDEKMELMEAKNPKIIPTIYNKVSKKEEERESYRYMVRICYEMDRPVSKKELSTSTDKACCFPARAVELDTIHEVFPQMLKLPAAGVYEKRMDNLMRFNIRLSTNRFIRKARRLYGKILHNLDKISAKMFGRKYMWYIIPDPEKPLQMEKGDRMPAGTQFVAVCTKEFFEPLQKK
jgi:hypothetical protein